MHEEEQGDGRALLDAEVERGSYAHQCSGRTTWMHLAEDVYVEVQGRHFHGYIAEGSGVCKTGWDIQGLDKVGANGVRVEEAECEVR